MKILRMKFLYICGPLTELPLETQQLIKSFYSVLADLCEKETGQRAFVPHEYFDPIKHSTFSPKEVDMEERKQICAKTSLLIVVAIAPSWGGGIEVEMANNNDIPIVILAEQGKKISRLLLGNPAVVDVIYYTSQEDALLQLEQNIVRYVKMVPSHFSNL